jgi:hypothetical protein
MKKKIVVVLTVLLTSAAALSLITATSRYIGFLQHPETLQPLRVFQVSPPHVEVVGVTVQVSALGPNTEKVASLLRSAFWVFEVSVVNGGDTPVDIDFDRVTLQIGDREVKALMTEEILRLFNERMTGAYSTSAGRRGHHEALDQLQVRAPGVARVFPGYARDALVFFQPHPEFPTEALLTLHGIRKVGSREDVPVMFRLLSGVGSLTASGNDT